MSLRRYLMTRARQVDKIYNWWCAQISICKHNRTGCFIEQATSSTQFSGLVWHVWTPSVSFCWQPRIPVSNIHWPSFWFLACNLCAVCKPPVAQHESGATFHRCDENGGWPRQCFFWGTYPSENSWNLENEAGRWVRRCKLQFWDQHNI